MTASSSTERPAFARYDAVLVDLDGVIYRGSDPITEAPEAIRRIRAAGTPLVFLTNNSSRTPEEVVEKLSSMGVEASPREVMTSALATAAMFERDPEAAPRTAFVIGRRGIREALTSIGVELAPVDAERADAVVIGWDDQATYGDLRTAGLLVQRGARLIGTNPDGSYPAPDGLWPGAGALLAAVVATTGAAPTVVGKPARPMFEAAAERAGASRPLVVGDRLDTDIAGATGLGWDSFLVLSGASGLHDLPATDVEPTYVGRTIRALTEPVPRVVVHEGDERERAEAATLVTCAGLPGVPETADAPASVLVAVDDRGGSSSVLATAATVPAGAGAVLRSVAVRQDVRGRGLGALIVAAALRRARSSGAPHVVAFTETAERFFAEMGFRRVDRASLPPEVRDGEHGSGGCATATAMMWSGPNAPGVAVP